MLVGEVLGLMCWGNVTCTLEEGIPGTAGAAKGEEADVGAVEVPEV